MKVIYIHGLDSIPNPEKLAILEDIGLEVVSPFIDYDKEQDTVYERVKAFAVDENIDAIIGSSMGGFIGFWLGRDLNIPALLFNPALFFESMQQFIPVIEEDINAPAYVCLGEKDQRVDPVEVRKYLEKLNPNYENLKIVSASWLEHGIDLSTFRSMSMWFLGELMSD